MTPLLLFLGLVTTELPPSYELHDTATKTLISPWPKTEAECVERASMSVGKWTCVTRRRFETVGTCADVPRPEVALVLNSEGFLVLPELKVAELPDGSWGPSEEQGYVPAPYPQCWVLGWVPYTGTWHAPEPDGVHEPVCHEEFPDSPACVPVTEPTP